MISPATPIIGTGGTRTDVLAFLLREFRIVPSSELWNYLTELERLCLLTGIRYDVACGQSYLECFNPQTGKPWDSKRFVENRNPAGLGIESDNDPDPATFTGTEAARVHVFALMVATGKTDHEPDDTLLFPGKAVKFYDQWMQKYNDPACPTVVTVADLQRRYVDATGEPQATWKDDDDYAERLCERANAIFGSDSGDFIEPRFATGNAPDRLIGDAETEADVAVRVGPDDLANGLHVGECQRRAVAAPRVDGGQNRLDVSGIDTARHPAEVVQIAPFRDRPDVALVVDDMGLAHLAADTDLAVFAAQAPLPNPARRRIATIFFDVVHRRVGHFARAVPPHIKQGDAANPILRSVVLRGDASCATTAALAQTEGDGIVRVHRWLQSSMPLPRLLTQRGGFVVGGIIPQ